MPSYYRCDGTVSDALVPNTARQCSTGWVQVDEPVYTLISYEQASGLISSLLAIAALYAVFKILYRVLR